MSINISELIWTVICFFALLFVLKTFFFDPVSRHMDERQSRIDAGLDEGRRAAESIAEERRAAEESWRRHSEQARETVALEQNRDAGDRARELEDQRNASALALENARADAEREETEARETVSSQGEQLARELADRLLNGGEER